MTSFLSSLNHLTPLTPASGQEKEPDFHFMLSVRDGNAMLATVDKDMKAVTPDYRNYPGDTGALLRSINRLSDNGWSSVSWDDNDTGISLADNPHLMYQLIRCRNIVSDKGVAIHVSPATATLNVILRELDEGKTLSPAIEAHCDNLELKSIRFLTDSFILAGRTIYPAGPVGDNFANLSFFLSPFEAATLDMFMSVFYSCFDNINVIYRDYETCFSRETVMAVPTIVFEKVYPDKAVQFHVLQTVDGVNEEFVRRFNLTRIADVGIDKTIVVKDIRYSSLDEKLDLLDKKLRAYAPSRQAAKEIYRDGNLFIIPATIAGPFLLQGLPALLATFNIQGLDKLKEYKVLPVKPRLKASLSSGIDFLEGSVDVEIDNEVFSLKDLLDQYRANRYVQLKNGIRAVIDDKYVRRLERIFRIKKGKKNNVEASFFDIPEIESLLDESTDCKSFSHYREFYEGFNRLHDEKLDIPGLKAQLRPYQAEGIKWLRYLHDNNMGGCLADDMGLGKTIQTIGMLSLLYPATAEPTLIVMPRSLLFNWQNEIARFNPSLSLYTYYTQSRDLDEAMKHQVILTTYAIVRNDIEALSARQFHYIILDESQNIKNLTAQLTRATFMLHGAHRLALSGTPIENNLSELYSLFHFLNPAMLGSLDDFNSLYANPIQRDNDKDATESLRRKIFPFMLRRLKKDVLKDLPDRIEQTMYVEMESEQKAFYEQRRRYYKERVTHTLATEGLQRSQFVMFQALSELRRIASVPESLTDGKIPSPKVELLVEHLVESVANGHKAVVFFNFIAGIELVGEQLDREGIYYASMTGSTRDRQSIVERFQNDRDCKVLLMTLKTGGVGLNLTSADTVFIFEPWWNKAAEEQAVNRLHRIGQKAKVMSYSIITHDTIEEKIMQLQQQKAQLFDSLINSDSSATKLLTEEDINFILS